MKTITTPAATLSQPGTVPAPKVQTSKIPTWTPERKGVVDGGFDRMGEDQGGTRLWGYFHKSEQRTPSYFLASAVDRRGGEEIAVYCSCPSHFWAVKGGDTGHVCKHMDALTDSLLSDAKEG